MTGAADRPGEVDVKADRAECDPRRDAGFDTARRFIRHRYEEDGCVVSIGEVLDHLDERFGGAGLTGDVAAVLGLCMDLWADPDIHQVPGGWIEFCWNGASPSRLDAQGVEALRARLNRRTGAGDSSVSRGLEASNSHSRPRREAGRA